ncbi:hypothetical protein [Actinoallomurus acaciae]|uniref:Secreted protein n=1 Tax=Actinoallomurus acaciae TaxID=502577 RepID=A0ABV5YD59_9ACTN
MIVPVVLVRRMAMTVVDVVGVVPVRDGDVAAVRPVPVGVPVVHQVLGVLTLVRVSFVAAMNVTVVDIVDVILVGEGHVTAALSVVMSVIGMDVVRHVLVLQARGARGRSALRPVRDLALVCGLRFQAVMVSARVVGYGGLRTPYDR